MSEDHSRFVCRWVCATYDACTTHAECREHNQITGMHVYVDISPRFQANRQTPLQGNCWQTYCTTCTTFANQRIFMSPCGIKHYEHRIASIIKGGNSPCQHTKNSVKPSLCIFPLFVWYIANATLWLGSGSKHMTFQHLPTNTCCMDISLYTCIRVPCVYEQSTIS